MAEANASDYEVDYTFNGLRDYLLLSEINSLYELMTTDELKGASIVIRTIADHLAKKHFVNEKMIDLYALIKTFEDLGEISLEMLINERSAKQSST